MRSHCHKWRSFLDGGDVFLLVAKPQARMLTSFFIRLYWHSDGVNCAAMPNRGTGACRFGAEPWLHISISGALMACLHERERQSIAFGQANRHHEKMSEFIKKTQNGPHCRVKPTIFSCILLVILSAETHNLSIIS